MAVTGTSPKSTLPGTLPVALAGLPGPRTGGPAMVLYQLSDDVSA